MNLPMRPTLFFIALVLFLVIDGVWLGVIAQGLYQRTLGELLRSQPDWLAAALFYLLYTFGLLIFVLVPGLSADTGALLAKAALFGFVAYGTYDLTNMATIAGWPWHLVAIDMAWGAVLTSLVSYLSLTIYRFFV